MGNMLGVDWWAPDLAPPEPEFVPKFDPMLGFPNGRKERVVNTTLDEMISAGVPLEYRDYCVDLYMKYLVCRKRNFPWIYKCKHEVHAHQTCEYADHTLRMKEYERERRLEKIAAKKEEEMKE